MASLSRQLSLAMALIALLLATLITGALYSSPAANDSDIAILLDPEQELDIQKVSSEQLQFRFSPWQPLYFSDYKQKGEVWLRIPLSFHQKENSEIQLLNIQASKSIHLTAFQVIDNRIKAASPHYKSNLNNYLFNISTAGNEGFLYVKTDATNIRSLHMQTASATALLKYFEILNIHSGWFFALFAVIVIFNCLMWQQTRLKQPFLLAAASSGIIFMMLLWQGRISLLPESPVTGQQLPLSLLLLSVITILVLVARKAFPSNSRAIKVYFNSIILLLTVAAAALIYDQSISSEAILMLGLILGISICTTYLLYRNKRPTDIYSIVAIAMIFAQTITLVAMVGAINLSFLSAMLIMMHCTALAMLALSFAPLFTPLFTRQSTYSDETSSVRASSQPKNNKDHTVFDAMGHELRTPLNGVLGISELLQTTHLTQKQSDYVHTLRSSGNDLSNLVNLLASAWKENHQNEAIPYDLQELISDSLSNFSHQSEQNQTELITSIHTNVPTYSHGNPATLSLLLECILSHAFQHIEKGDILLNVCSAEKYRDQITFEIKMSHTLKALYPFDQQKSYKAYKNSMGMNLALFLALQQASETLISTPEISDDLTHFRFSIDCTAHKKEIMQGRKQNTVKTYHQHKILIIDDNHTCRRVLAEQCSLLGLNCIEAESGHEALAILRNEFHLNRQFDGIILDQNMPGMKGIQLLERLNVEFPETGTPPVIMLTGTSNPPENGHAKSLGIQSILTKPVTRFTLQKALDQSIGKSKNRQKIAETA